jgi:uncharacterized protein YcfL
VRQKQTLLCLAAFALVGGGCTSVNTYENAAPQGQRQEVADSRVITDPTLAARACVVGVNAATAANGIMRLQVEVKNLTRRAQTFFYNIEWFDLNGMLVSTAGGGWTERQIMSKEILTIQATAPSIACKDFRMKLMEHPRLRPGQLMPTPR